MSDSQTPFIPFTRPSFNQETIHAVSEVLRSGWVTSGPKLAEFEAALSKYFGDRPVRCFANGTATMKIALQVAGIGEGDEVITTPISWVATSNVILSVGAKPVFVDIDQHSLNLDPKKIEAAITSKTTAIMPVHCYGNPCDVEEIERIAKKHSLRIIYDAAHAFGVQINGRSLLNYGDLSILSFHATKVFNTFEGGAIICPDLQTKKHIDQLKNFGFIDEVTVTSPGINGKMSEINAAFGLLQLKYVDQAIDKRRKVDFVYRKSLDKIRGITCLQGASSATQNYSYFPVLVSPEFPLTRDEIYQRLKDKNIFSRRYFYPLISQFPMYSHLPSANALNLPNAVKAADQILCLPIYPDLVEQEQGAVIDAIAECSQ